MKTVTSAWPTLRSEEWEPTAPTLHRWAQIVGKTRLALAPFQNHWWHCTLYVSPRGLSTSAMPYEDRNLEAEFDFLDDALVVRTSDGDERRMPLAEQSVASFYHEYCEMLTGLGVTHLSFHAAPNEVVDATPFADDREHATYDGDVVRRWWHALMHADLTLKRFRSHFAGKCSPSHVWWGALDLACTRFSGRAAPKYTGTVPNCPAYVMEEAYSDECISAGWWMGNPGSSVSEAAFYAYAYPEPNGCPAATISPSDAYYSSELREWILPYDTVRRSQDPDAMVAEFLESTYDVAARLGKWDVERLRSSH